MPNNLYNPLASTIGLAPFGSPLAAQVNDLFAAQTAISGSNLLTAASAPASSVEPLNLAQALPSAVATTQQADAGAVLPAVPLAQLNQASDQLFAAMQSLGSADALFATNFGAATNPTTNPVPASSPEDRSGGAGGSSGASSGSDNLSQAAGLVAPQSPSAYDNGSASNQALFQSASLPVQADGGVQGADPVPAGVPQGGDLTKAAPAFAVPAKMVARADANPVPAHFHFQGTWFAAAVDATGFAFTPTTGGASVGLRLVGGDPFAPVAPTVTVGKSNFIADAGAVATTAGHTAFGATAFHEVYPGIDVQYASTPTQNLEYSFVVRPGGNPDAIRLAATGTRGVSLDAQGNLLLHTAAGDLTSRVPVLFQTVNGTRVSVEGGYQLLADGTVGFKVGHYDHSQALTIDPDLGSAPHAINQEATTNEDVAANVYWLTYNDTSDDLSTITLTGVTQGAHGTTVLNANGSVTYTPATHWSGTDTFTYTISNGEGTATANATVTVNPVDYPGVANAVNVSTNQNTAAAVTLSGTDVEGSPLTYVIAQTPGHGTLGAIGGVNGNQLTYYPGGNFSGTDTFTYQADDGQGQGLGAAATVTVTVNAVTQTPGVTITPNGGPIALTEPVFQAPNSGSYTVVLNTQPSANVTVTPSTDQSQLQVTPASLTFTPQNWATAQTVTVQPVDDLIAQGAHTVTITHAATSADATYNNISTPSVPVALTDGDFAGIAAGPSSLTQGDLNEQGATSAPYQVQLTSQPTANVTITLAPDSSASLSASTLTFTPANWNTAQTVTLTLNAETVAEGYHQTTATLTAASSDAAYQGQTTTFSQNILDKDGPNALADVAVTDENTVGHFSVLANDVSPQGYTLTVTAVTQPAHGTVATGSYGNMTYTPQSMWSGSDSFGYTIGDGHGGSDHSTVSVTVNEVEQPPTVINPGTQTNAEDAKVSLQIVASDTDETGFVYTAYGLPPGVTMDAMTGRIWGWIDPRGRGTYSPHVIVDDMNGGVSNVGFTWTITHTNHAPHLNDWSDLITQYGASIQRSGFTSVDIDSDPITYTVTGLPPGINYDAANNQVSGTLTMAGSYEVNVKATDSQNAWDANSFAWQVLPVSTSIPVAYVTFGYNPNITLLSTGTPLTAQVTLGVDGNQDTLYGVSLVVNPIGRAWLDTPAVIPMHNGQTVTFHIYPTAISQRVDDVTVQAFVASRETSRVQFTIADVILPNLIRGADTPQSMKNRISLNPGNWGSYAGVVQVTPNLLGVHSVGLGVMRPQADDKYGNATADSTDVARLSYVTQGVVKVSGTVQTAPSLGADGLDDGLARNADNLWLQAVVGVTTVTMTTRFAVAAIPITAKATNAQPQNALGTPAAVKWFWGAQYTMRWISDTGNEADLDKVFIIEDLERPLVGGLFATIKLVKQTKWLPAIPPQGATINDYNGLSGFENITAAAATTTLRLGLKAGGGEDQKNEFQYWRFYNSGTDVKPPKPEDADVIDKSAFVIYTFSDPKPAALKVERRPSNSGVGGAKAGIVDKTAEGEQKIVI